MWPLTKKTSDCLLRTVTKKTPMIFKKNTISCKHDVNYAKSKSKTWWRSTVIGCKWAWNWKEWRSSETVRERESERKRERECWVRKVKGYPWMTTHFLYINIVLLSMSVAEESRVRNGIFPCKRFTNDLPLFSTLSCINIVSKLHLACQVWYSSRVWTKMLSSLAITACLTSQQVTTIAPRLIWIETSCLDRKLEWKKVKKNRSEDPIHSQVTVRRNLWWSTTNVATRLSTTGKLRMLKVKLHSFD